MSAVSIAVWDEDTVGRKEERPRLRLASRSITAGDLIARRVTQEVEQHNRSNAEVFSGLIQPEGAERELNGTFRLKKHRPLDPALQVQRAIEGFRTNQILLLVDDRQVEDIDHLLELDEESSVTFLRLIPLVGG